MTSKLVPHVHFHVIPKPGESDETGLGVGWPMQKVSKEDLEEVYEEIKGKL